ncbi:hypothetical protein SAMD00019534_071360, partial [Acytostelium subglobosum LB1]|uniref:hypothetical protein n=1 Tax=Acytostelium subglobosum LB1 TaxID=1410327 RepID=UPI000644D94A
MWNKPIEPGSIPSIVTQITFGERFNQHIPLGALPPSLTALKFGHSFNRPIAPGAIPSSVTKLKFGNMFDQVIIPGCLPSGLKSLDFGDCFDTQLPVGCLPPSLESLFLYYAIYNHPILPGLLPMSLTQLALPHHKHEIQPGVIPSSVTSLWLDTKLILSQGVIPDSVLKLCFHLGPHSTSLYIPSSVTDLSLQYPEFFRAPKSGYKWIPIPLTVKRLVISCSQPITPGSIPQSVTKLKIIGGYNLPIMPMVIPLSVTSLAFGDSFTQPIRSGDIPSTVTKLSVGFNLKRLLTPNNVQSSYQSYWNGDTPQRHLGDLINATSIDYLIINQTICQVGFSAKPSDQTRKVNTVRIVIPDPETGIPFEERKVKTLPSASSLFNKFKAKYDLRCYFGIAHNNIYIFDFGRIGTTSVHCRQLDNQSILVDCADYFGSVSLNN